MNPAYPYSAYLCACLQFEPGEPLPRVCGFEIFSSPPESLSYQAGRIYACVLSMPGESYRGARDKLVDIINSCPHLAWARIWVNESYEAHQERGRILGYIKEECPTCQGEQGANPQSPITRRSWKMDCRHCWGLVVPDKEDGHIGVRCVSCQKFESAHGFFSRQLPTPPVDPRPWLEHIKRSFEEDRDLELVALCSRDHDWAIRLLFVSTGTFATGAVTPFGHRIEGLPKMVFIADITPVEWGDVQVGRIPLPQDWAVERVIVRGDHQHLHLEYEKTVGPLFSQRIGVICKVCRAELDENKVCPSCSAKAIGSPSVAPPTPAPHPPGPSATKTSERLSEVVDEDGVVWAQAPQGKISVNIDPAAGRDEDCTLEPDELKY